MVDFDKIGQRIKEQRKSIMKVSQEKMAEDLYMYQADISNLEKAKSGSGITDLQKLDDIASYLNIPLETLLFGREGKNMPTYHGSKMQLKRVQKKLSKEQKQILAKLTGCDALEDTVPVMCHECGPYSLYSLIEALMVPGKGEAWDKPETVLHKLHTYIFLGPEIIAVMVSDLTTVMEHVYQPALHQLQEYIQMDVLDVTDAYRTLNPYWALWYFSNDDEKNQYEKLMYERMDAIRETGENRPIIYIESVYVREDCRRHGMFRLYVDLLKQTYGGCILWLNMEPTEGNELGSEYTTMPAYSVSELGQLNINAAIAEKTGFTVDPDTWHRAAEVVDDEGNVTVKTCLIRKCAYYLPKEIRKLIQNDGNLVELGRAKQKTQAAVSDAKAGGTMDINHGNIGDDIAAEIRINDPGEKLYYVTAIASPDGSRRYVVSYSSLLRDKKEWIIEQYDSLEDAEKSEYFDTIKTANGFLTIAVMSKGSDESIVFDRIRATGKSLIMPEELGNASLKDEDNTENSMDEDSYHFLQEYEETAEIENFDIVSDTSYTISAGEDQVFVNGLEAKLKRTNTDKIGEILYAFSFYDLNGKCYYWLSRNSIVGHNDIKEWMNFEILLNNIDAIAVFDDSNVELSKYYPIFKVIRDHI